MGLMRGILIALPFAPIVWAGILYGVLAMLGII